MKKIILMAGLSMLLLVAMAAPAMAQWDISVQVGDWFLYEGTLVQWDADPSIEFPPWYATYLYDWNNTNWYNYTVTAIDADLINYTLVTSWTNGSLVTTDYSYNTTNGADYMVIGANLTEGEVLRGGDFLNAGDRVLNASIMLDTPNGTRLTNVMNYTSEFAGSVYTYLYYWDSIYGCQIYRELSGDTADFDYRGKLELVDSSLGVVVPDLTGPLLLLTIMSITVPIALLHRRKKMPKVTI